MKKLAHLVLSLVLVLSLAGISQAGGKNILDPLAEITPMGCTEVDISPFGTSLLAAWDWSEGTDQTKFGGDAVYMVEASSSGFDGPYEWLVVEIELDKYELGTPAEDYVGKLVYRCSNEQSDPSGSCNAAALNLHEALLAAAADKLEADDSVFIRGYELQWVYVKAINPSFYPVNKRENYLLVDVCSAGGTDPGDSDPGDSDPGDSGIIDE